MSLVDTAMAKMQTLPPERQQEIIDFIDFLLSRGPWAQAPNDQIEVQHPNEVDGVSSIPEAVSILAAAGDLIGCVEGPSDLSTHPQHRLGYGTY
jgi:hypothetical protein